MNELPPYEEWSKDHPDLIVITYPVPEEKKLLPKEIKHTTRFEDGGR